MSNNAGEIVGGVVMLAFVVMAVIAAVISILAFGAVIGFSVGLANYVKSFRANVKLERPTP